MPPGPSSNRAATPSFTYEAVAARAETSKPVLYRRWPTKVDLVLAALQHGGLFDRRTVPDTGTLRGDILATLRTSTTHAPASSP